MDMKKIGHEVSFIAPRENNPRNGEGDFIRLNDGRIMYVYCGFLGSSWGDDMPSDIRAIFSSDEGDTWADDCIILQHDEQSANFMCPSVMRMANGDVGLFYLRKFEYCGGISDDVCLVRSSDEGKTWSAPVHITDSTEYFVMENDHIVRLESGRLMVPLNLHSYMEDGVLKRTGHGLMCLFASDDDGRTWYEISDRLDIPFAELSETGLQETMLYQSLDGSVRAFSRTDLGFQYECVSCDDCKTWTTPKPNTFFTSPPSPLMMKRFGELTLAVFNPIPDYAGRDPDEPWGRTPFVMAVSRDDGKTFPNIYYLEDDLKNGYCYPAIFDGGDYVLVGYYHSNNTRVPLNSNKIIKILKSELD